MNTDLSIRKDILFYILKNCILGNNIRRIVYIFNYIILFLTNIYTN